MSSEQGSDCQSDDAKRQKRGWVQPDSVMALGEALRARSLPCSEMRAIMPDLAQAELAGQPIKDLPQFAPILLHLKWCHECFDGYIEHLYQESEE